jgi:hypothetical protein
MSGGSRGPRRRGGVKTAIAALMLLAAACSDSAGSPRYFDSGTDATDAAVDTPPRHCCMASTATCAVQFPPTESCQPPPSDPDAGFSQYGHWSCASGTCSDDGRSCSVGDPCSITDVLVDCTGVVVECR